MDRGNKTTNRLLQELDSLRQRVAELESLERQNRQINEELRLFKSVVDASHEAIAISDPEGWLLYINLAHEKLFGRPLEEARRLNYRDYYPPESLEVLNREVAPALERGESWEGELEVFDASGRRIPMWERADSIRDADGSLLYGFGLMHNISNRKGLEQRLQEALELNQKIFAASPLGISAYKMSTGECIVANDAAARIIGSTREEVLQQNFYQIESWQSSGLLETAKKALASNREERQEIHTTSTFGKEVWLDCRFNTFTLQGEPHLFLLFDDIIQRKHAEAALQRYQAGLEKRVEERTRQLTKTNKELRVEISERRQAEAALKSERDFVAALLDVVGALVVVLDRDGRIVRFNQTCQTVTGYRADEVLRQPFGEIFLLPEEREAVMGVFQSLATGDFPSTFENHWLTKDGKKKLIAWSNTALGDANGQVTYIIGTGIDITASRQAEEALKESEQRYSSLFENNHAVMLLIDPETAAIVDANPAACSFYGMDRAELTAKKITDINTLPSGQVFQEMQRARSREHQVFHFRHRLATGDIRDVEVFSGPIEVRGRQLLYSIVHDITARKQAEEALRQSEERFRAIFDHVSVGMALVDANGCVLMANDADCRFLGYLREELVGLHFPAFTHPDDAVIDAELYESLLRGERESYVIDKRYIRKDGDIVWGRLSVSLVRDEQGQPQYTVIACEDITEQRQAEEALKKSQQQRKAILDNIPDIAWLKDRDSRFISVNEPFGQACGVRPEDLVGQTDLDIWPQELAERYRADDQEVMQTGKRKRVEEPLAAKDGSASWIETIKTPIFNEQGEIIGTTGIARDITARKQAEEELRATKAQLEYLLSSTPAVIYSCKAEGDYRYTFVSGNITVLLGYEPEAFIDNPGFWEKQVHPEDLHKGQENFLRMFELGWFSYEYRFRHKDGSYRWIHDESKLVRDKTGQPLEIVGFVLDITARKEAEAELHKYREHLERLVEERTAALTQVNKKLLAEIAERARTESALRESEVRLRTIFEGSPIAIGLRDMEGRFVEVNEAMTRMLGYSREELRTMSLGLVTHPDDESNRHALFYDLITGKKDSYSLDARFFRKDGNLRWGNIHASLVRGEDGTPQFSISIFQDITWEKQAEEELAAYQENLRSLASELSLTEERERRRLAEFLHDDVGQPLALAKIKLGELQQEVSEPRGLKAVNEVRGFLEQAIGSTRNLTFELSLPILYEMGLEEAVEWLAEQFHIQHGLKVEVKRDQAPKPLTEGARVLLFRLVRELLTNVVKHARANQIIISFVRQNDHLFIQLQDDGIGFDTAQTASPAAIASGFGLFSVRERLSHLGGHMEVHSTPGRGTRVNIIVPLKKREDDHPAH